MAGLNGALTHATVGARFEQLVRAGAAEDVLDLSDVDAVDSAAVALLLAIRRRRGRPLQLTGASERLQRLIACFGAEQLLTGSPR